MVRRVFAVLALLSAGIVCPASATGFLSVESSPGGAEVWYTGPDDPDRKYLGDTPLEKRELPTGRYNLWLILSSHDTLEIPDVAVAEGQHTLVNREIPTHYGYLEVLTEPDSAAIWLDGVQAGTAPFENNLMLAGKRKLKVDPREAHFRNSGRSLEINRGDTLRLSVQSPYRNKSFLQENLSLTPWRIQFEFGLQQRTSTGYYDSTKRDPFSKSEKRGQTDFPLGVRLGLPQGLEAHLLLPFKNYDDKDTVLDAAVFPSNLKLGLKYTFRPLNIGADISYALGSKEVGSSLSNDYLALTLLGMASKGNIVADAQAGFEFHFSDKDSSELDYGDQAMVHAQVGYLLDPFLPYLGVTGVFRLNGSQDGESLENSGFLVIPEPGFTVEIDDFIAFQAGVPFTVMGKRNLSYWGLHGSLSVSFGFM
jgi:hypothetical protein